MKVFAVNADGKLEKLAVKERDGNKIILSQFDGDDDGGEYDEEEIIFGFATLDEIDFSGPEWVVNTTVRVFNGQHWKELKEQTGMSDLELLEDYLDSVNAGIYKEYQPGQIKIELIEGEESSTDGTILDSYVIKDAPEFEEIDVGGPRVSKPIPGPRVPDGGAGGEGGTGGYPGGGGGGETQRTQERPQQRERVRENERNSN